MLSVRLKNKTSLCKCIGQSVIVEALSSYLRYHIKGAGLKPTVYGVLKLAPKLPG